MPTPFNRSFRELCLKQMVDHFNLPDRVINSMQEFTPEDNFTFLSSIKQNYHGGLFKLIEELVLLSISKGTYDARSHYLIIETAELLGIPRDLVEMHCESIYELLLKAQKNLVEGTDSSENDKDRERRATRKKLKKYLVIGLASLGGGAVIGLTGGLAAPVVASAFAGVIGAGSIVMSSAAAGVVGSLFGVAGAGLTASKMNKRIGDLEEFAFQSLSPDQDQTSLTITIAVSGWISEEGHQQFAIPWKHLRHTREQYCLCYESKYLLELSTAMDYLLSFVVSYATQEALKYTFLASVMAAIAWPTALISIANIIDNPWDVCIGRSAEAGKHMADVLMSRKQGRRPASLIGFSLGARVIYFCLQELAERKESEGMIGDVILLGAPVSASVEHWKHMSRIVSGKIVNGYSSSDWMLKFLYRTSSAAIHVAGLQEIRWTDRRLKNVDLTHIVTGHMDYYKKLTEILDYINVRTVVNFEDDLMVATEQPTSDSGIGRSESNSTNVSVSISQQSLTATDLPENPLTLQLQQQLHSSQIAAQASSSSSGTKQPIPEYNKHQRSNRSAQRPAQGNISGGKAQIRVRLPQSESESYADAIGNRRCRPSSLARRRADLRLVGRCSFQQRNRSRSM